MNQPPSPPSPGSAFAPLAVPTEWLIQALDSLAIPVALLTAPAELAYANLAFQRVLADTQGPLRLRAGRLQPAVASAASAFAASLAAAAGGEQRQLQAATEGLDGRVGPLKGARLGVPPGPGPGLGPEPEAEPQRAWLVLTLQEGGSQILDLYAAQFGLSPAEARVLKSVAEGADTAQVARRYGLKVATVRDHLVSIRRKTGQPSQQALLMELARLPPLTHLPVALAASLGPAAEEPPAPPARQ
jgi:DNA-binding CsgD family transcriptional regulator